MASLTQWTWVPANSWRTGDSEGEESLACCSPWDIKESDMTEWTITTSFVIAFLPRSKHLLISWLQSLSAVILESKKRKSVTVLQEGGPLPGPNTGLLSNTRKWIVQGDTCADKPRDFIGKGHPGGEQEVREPRRTALPRLGFYGDGISFRVVFGQSF